MSQTPHIESFTLGPWMTNCYVVHDPDSRACWIVDVGFEPGEMIGYIERQNLTPEQVILTHGHLDHVGGLEAVLAKWPDLPVLIHEAEKDFPGDANLNLSAPFGMPMVAREPTGTIEAGTTQTIGEASFEVRHTPGHSPGGISLYCEAGGLIFQPRTSRPCSAASANSFTPCRTRRRCCPATARQRRSAARSRATRSCVKHEFSERARS